MKKLKDASQNISKDCVTLEELMGIGDEAFEKIRKDWSEWARIDRERQIENRERAKAAVPEIKLTATRKGDDPNNFFHKVSLQPEISYFGDGGWIDRADFLIDAITAEIKMNLGAPDESIGDDTPYAFALEEVIRRLLIGRMQAKGKNQISGKKEKNVEKRIIPPAELKAKTLELIGHGDIKSQEDLKRRLSRKFTRRNGDKARPIDIHTRLEKLRKKDEEVAAALGRLPIKDASKKRQ